MLRYFFNPVWMHGGLCLLVFCLLAHRGYAQTIVEPTATILFSFPQKEAAPDSFYLVIDQDFEMIRYHAKTDTISVSAGEHRLTIIEADSKDAVLSVDLLPGDTLNRAVSLSPIRNPKEQIRHSAIPVIENGANLYVITDSDTDIYIDNVQVSSGEAMALTTDSIIVVETRHPMMGTLRKEILPRPDRMTVLELFHRPNRSTAMTRSLIPGVGQFYKREPVKALVAAGLVVGSIGYGVKLAVDAHDLNEDYKLLSRKYYGTPNEILAVEYGAETHDAYVRARNVAKRRNLVLGAAAGFYLLSIVDAAIAPRGGFRPSSEKQINWSVGPTSDGLVLNISF